MTGGNRPVQSVTISVVYPKPQQQIFEDSTFLMGQIKGLAQSGGEPLVLRMNGQPVPVSEHGFFAWKVNLKPGLNPVKLDALLPHSTTPQAQDIFAVYRVPPKKPLPALPLAMDEETVTPVSDVWLSERDTLTVGCLASVDADVSMTIAGVPELSFPLKSIDIKEPYLDTRERIFAKRHWTRERIPAQGYYEANIPASQLFAIKKPIHNAPLAVHLKNGTHTLQKTLPGKLTLLTKPKLAVLKENAVSRVAPEDGDRLTPQKAGTIFAIDGLCNRWVRARLSTDECMVLPLKAMRFLPADTIFSVQTLETIQLESVNAWISNVLLLFGNQTHGACPIAIESLPPSEVNRLQVRLYGVHADGDAIQDAPTDNRVIRQIHRRAVAENVVELWIDLHRPLAGYDYAIVGGQWRLMVKTLPPEIAQTRVLIDPGHGGVEFGALGLNGVPEKSVNLKVSRLLRDALTAAGFRVFMTRDDDVEVSLEARQRKAIEVQADVLVSIHHNALPDGRDPLKDIGACCFSYYPFSKALAKTLLAGLIAPPNGLPDNGLFEESLFIPRIHQATSVLVEVGFFTHPQEFERLIDPAFQKDVAQRLACAVTEYCRLRQ